MVGSTLNHYRLVKALGSGGMGDVYLADDTRLKRQVAIKILPAALAPQPDRRERFEREAQAIAALNHPNIVTIFSVEQSADTHFLTMEFVDGRTLADVLPKGGLPLKRLLAITRQIVDAVIAAHDRGIVHRDLKPANVMVTANDHVKVLDFGLAKLRESGDAAISASMPTREITGEGKIVGTVAYMSPEQAEGKPVDGRSDIFSIGVMLYELATGEAPFKGDTSLSVLSSILRDTPKAVTELNAALPRDFARITRHCLAKDADRRYQSAKDLRNDLDELTQALDSGELNAPPGAGHARRRVWPMAAAACVAIAAIGLVAALWLRGLAVRTASAPPTAVHTQLTQAAGVEQFPSLSPDGKWVVYARDGDIFLQSATGQTAINLTNDAGASNTMPAFSPDGELIAFRSGREGAGIFLMGRTGESVRRLTPDGFYPSWFPDGRQIIYSTEGPAGPENRLVFSELDVVSVAGGEPRRLVQGDAVQPRVSPHGRRIAYWAVPSNAATRRFVGSASGSNRDIWTVDASGHNPVRVTTHDANDWNPVWSPDGAWIYFLSNRAGSMNLWRVAIDETSGVTRGEPEALTAPAQYVAHFTLSADGRTGAYASTSNTSNIGRVSFDSRTGAVTGSPTPVTTGTHDFVYMDVSPDARFIAAATSSRTREDVYVVSVADGSLRQLTNDFARDRSPRWSPDGRGIYFYSDRARYALWRIEADGSGLRQLTTGAERYYPVPTRDGARVASVDLNARQLFVYETNDFSKPPNALPPFPDPNPNAYPQPSDWSPDGRALLIASVGGGSLWLYSRDTRTYRRLVDVAPGPGAGVWLGDGRRIVYDNLGRLFIADAASLSTREILASPGEALLRPRVTPDGSQLFFLRSTSDGDIWLVRFNQK